MKVVIIGGGPAGMLSAISAGTNKNDVTILEKMNMLGRKLLITGKGRCNITSSISIDEFIKNVPGNGKFLYSCLNNFTNEDILNILKEEGLQTKVERGNRVFPITDKSQDVLQALLNRLKKLKVKIEVGANVKEILTEQDIVSGVKYIQGGKEKILKADKVILATGGKSYSATGSTGDGYELAKKVGHTVTEIKPSLVPISTKGKDLEICRRMQGLSLKNVAIKIKDAKNNKIIYEDFGELLFTHFGVSGPTVLSASSYAVDIIRKRPLRLVIDLKPALDEKQLDARILRDFEANINRKFMNSLDKLFPKSLIPVIIERSGIDAQCRVNEITRDKRQGLVKLIKNFDLTLTGLRGFNEAIITHGGVDVKEIDSSTMESKLIKGLYFAGEMIDVDAVTGGFNLQVAWSTGYLAGISQNI